LTGEKDFLLRPGKDYPFFSFLPEDFFPFHFADARLVMFFKLYSWEIFSMRTAAVFF